MTNYEEISTNNSADSTERVVLVPDHQSLLDDLINQEVGQLEAQQAVLRKKLLKDTLRRDTLTLRRLSLSGVPVAGALQEYVREWRVTRLRRRIRGEQLEYNGLDQRISELRRIPSELENGRKESAISLVSEAVERMASVGPGLLPPDDAEGRRGKRDALINELERASRVNDLLRVLDPDKSQEMEWIIDERKTKFAERFANPVVRE